MLDINTSCNKLGFSPNYSSLFKIRSLNELEVIRPSLLSFGLPRWQEADTQEWGGADRAKSGGKFPKTYK